MNSLDWKNSRQQQEIKAGSKWGRWEKTGKVQKARVVGYSSVLQTQLYGSSLLPKRGSPALTSLFPGTGLTLSLARTPGLPGCFAASTETLQ